jgi:hypothetical protein
MPRSCGLRLSGLALLLLVGLLRMEPAEAQTFALDPHLVVFGGGNVDDIVPLTEGRARSIWVTVGGTLLGYTPGAPAFVNQAFLAAHPGGLLPENSILVVLVPAGSGPPLPGRLGPTATTVQQPPATPTPLTIPIPTPTPAPTPTPTPTTVPVLETVIQGPGGQWVNDVNYVRVQSDGVVVSWELRTGLDGFFSFLEQWHSRSSFVHINVDLEGDGEDDILISPDDRWVTMYRKVGDYGLSSLASAPVESQRRDGSEYSASNLLRFALPLEHFGSHPDIHFRVAGAWARDLPDCSGLSYSCSWYRWYDLPVSGYATAKIR